jgi:hypothetical protein
MRLPESPDDRADAYAAPADTRDTRLERMVPMLLEGLPQLLDEVRGLLNDEWPDYARFMAAADDEVNVAAESFMRWLVHIAGHGLTDLPQHAVPGFGAPAELFEEIGRIQWREGRDVSALLSAYQVGGRAAWHYVSRTALAAGVAPEVLAALAEAVFIFIDQLSSASAHGYVREQAEAGATRERRRDELVELLLSDRADMVAVRAAAARVGWRMPREAAVLLIDPANPVGQAMLARLDNSCLLIRRTGEIAGAIVPDPVRPGRRERLVSALRGASAVIGHPVDLQYLPLSAHIAEMACAAQDGRRAPRRPGLRGGTPRRDHRAPRCPAARCAAPADSRAARRTRAGRTEPAVRDAHVLAASHGRSSGHRRRPAHPPADRAVPDGSAA